MLLKDKVIIITGAARGLGWGIAEACLREGARCLLADVLTEELASKVGGISGIAVPVFCDVTQRADLERLVDEGVRRFGRIDGVVNNAGANFCKPFLETTQSDWDRILAIDLTAAYVLTQLACRQMLEQSPCGGSIVNITSVHARATVPGAGPYAAAKCGVTGLTRAVALEFADRAIRVNAIAPGLCETAMWQAAMSAAKDKQACQDYWLSNIPMGRTILPKEIGELAVFLLSVHSAAITGCEMNLDCGMSAGVFSKDNYE